MSRFQVTTAVPNGWGHTVKNEEFTELPKLFSYLEELAKIEIDPDFSQIVSVRIMMLKD